MQIIQHNPITLILNKIFQKCDLIQNLSTYLSNLFLNHIDDKPIAKWIFALGISFITYKTFSTLLKQYSMFDWVFGHFNAKNKFNENGFIKRYGSNKKKQSVLITGGADGIGLSFCHKFAKMGFNLIITDVNEEKLKRRKAQLIQKYGVKVFIRAFDMTNPQKMDRFLSQLSGPFGKDIRIVVNNVGMITMGTFLKVDPIKTQMLLALNFLPMYKINKVMIPKLREIAFQDGQGKRSAIINITSSSAKYYCPCIGAYASSKKIADVYSRTISVENRDLIDIISITPFGVTTNLTKMLKNSFMITPKQCAQASIIDLYAQYQSSYTSASHKFIDGYFRTLAESQIVQFYLDVQGISK